MYDSTDAATRDLAERLVAVSRRDYQRATGLTGSALLQAMRRGADAAYIVSVDRRPLDPCREWLVTLTMAPWLDSGSIVPIADTRLHAIVRRGRAGITTEWDGGVLLSAADREP